MQLVVVPNHFTLEEYMTRGITHFLFGIKGLSSGFSHPVTIEELKNLKIKYQNATFFVSCNKTMLENDLDTLQSTLQELDELGLAGICFYDLAVLEITQELGLKTPLIWNQTHLVTNYQTCEYYYEQGVMGAYLASELTLEELCEIKEKSQVKCFALVLGCPIMAASLRSLVTNYYDFLGKEKKDHLLLEERVSKQQYRVVQSDSGTVFYKNTIINGSKPLLDLAATCFDYGVLDETGMNHPLFLELISCYQELLVAKEKEPLLERIVSLIGNDTNFFYQKTIFKVRKDDK